MRAAFGRTSRLSVLLTLTAGITALSVPLSGYAAPGDVNSINTGRDIPAGTYFNTPGSRTTFTNPNGGLWLHSGNLVRGLESSINKVPDGNGGTLYFRAPGNVVRLDGNIDVSAVRNGTLYTGNGGKVFVDSGYLFQNGNIFANGANGGLVQFNVGGMTLNSNAQITAQGFGGNGGTVAISSPGTIDIRPGAVIDTSGKVTGTVDTNIINIEGSAVNNQGVLRANGAFGQDTKPNDGDSQVMANNPRLANNAVPPQISAGNGTHDTATMSNVLFQIPGNAAFRGGTIRLVAAGQNKSTTDVINGADSQLISSADKSALNSRNAAVVQNNNGDVFNRGGLAADGALGKNGGTIILAAARNVINSGSIHALGSNGIDGVFSSNGSGSNGGNGGSIVVTAMNVISNSGGIQANGGQGARAQSVSSTTGNGKNALARVTGTAGTGGQGGVLAFSYGSGFNNSGSLQATGGQGGAGGNANSFDTEGATSGNPNPVARAASIGGAGGAGGAGGLLVFSGNGNPTGSGSILSNGGQGGRGGNAWADAQANSNIGTPSGQSTATKGAGGTGGRGGTLVTPNPGNFTTFFSTKAGGAGNSGSAAARQVAIRNGVAHITSNSSPVLLGSLTTGPNHALLATRRNEYIRHEDMGILLSQNSGAGNNNTTFSGRLGDALIRTVNTPGGSTASALSDAESVNNLVIADTTPQALNTNLTNSNINPLFFDLNSLTVLNNGNFSNNMLWTPGVHVVGAGFHDIEFALGGGHISWLVNGSVTNNQIVMTRGLWGGGSTQVAATQDVVNNNDFINITSFKDLLSGFNVSGPEYESTHAGSLILKGGRDIINSGSGKLESNLIFFDIHPPLNQNPPIDWPRFLNGAQIGATVNMLAGRNLSNAGLIRADALTYRNGAVGGQNPALAIGGIVIGRHGSGTTSNTGTLTAQGNSFFSPNEADGPRFNKNTFPAATSFNGTIDFK